jgi:hypothetical protein
MAVTVFQVNVSVHGGFGFSPFGETGEGFLQVNGGSLECCRLLQMLGQCVAVAEEPPLSVGHLPQIRQWEFGMRIEQLVRRI